MNLRIWYLIPSVLNNIDWNSYIARWKTVGTGNWSCPVSTQQLAFKTTQQIKCWTCPRRILCACGMTTGCFWAKTNQVAFFWSAAHTEPGLRANGHQRQYNMPPQKINMEIDGYVKLACFKIIQNQQCLKDWTWHLSRFSGPWSKKSGYEFTVEHSWHPKIILKSTLP